MREQRLVIAAATVLVIVGISCVCVRVRFMKPPNLRPGESEWRVTYAIRFRAEKAGGRIRVAIPDSTPRARVFRETFSHLGMSMDLLTLKHTRDREAVLVPTLGDTECQFVMESDIHLRPNSTSCREGPGATLPPDVRARYLQKEKDIQLANPHVARIMATLTSDAVKKDEILKRIFEYCAESIAEGSAGDHCDAASTLDAGYGTCLGRARAMIALCRSAKIPARLVTGFIAEKNEDAQKHFWVEVWNKNGWAAYDPEYGHACDVPTTYLAVRRDDASVVRAPDDASWQFRCSISRLAPSSVIVAAEDEWPASILDLTRLPPGMQQVIALLLLLPIAALITAVVRNLIGIRTFGTFGPGLLALSLIYADWRMGAVVLILVIGIGLAARLVLNQMNLHMVARLGIILTCVVVCMTFIVSAMDYWELTPSARAALLPLVVLTMLIERFSVTAEEDGLLYAGKVLLGTLVTAACCLVMLQAEGLSRLVLRFPEGQCLVAAALLLVGRYAGYRLTELWRFRDLAALKPPESP